MKTEDEYKCHDMKQFKHIPSGAICDYVDGHVYDGHEIVMIDIKGVWKMVGAYDFDENVRNGVIELLGGSNE